MQRSNQGDANPSTHTIIYMGLIPFDWTEENLRAVVCSMGPVLDIHFSMDHYGKNKGYAFIEFQTAQQAQNAIAVLLKSQVINPMTGYTRRFKANLSKEPSKANNLTVRQPLILNPSAMPPGMQFPPDFVPISPAVPSMQYTDSYSQRGQDPYGQPQQRHGNMNSNLTPPPPPPPPASTVPTTEIPNRYLKATEILPIPKKLPFSTPDKISETLASLPPAELMQLISHLKVMLASGEVTRAAEIFQLSPQLATAATQALLLMGFVDEAVITETMKSGGALPHAVPETTPSGTNFQRKNGNNQFGTNAPPPPQGPPQDFNRGNFYPQSNYGQQQGFGQQQNHGQSPNFGQAGPQGGHPPPHQNYRPQNNYNRNYNQIPNNSQGNSNVIPPPQPQNAAPPLGLWPKLPPATRIKLSKLPPNEANVIADILSMPMEQFNQLDAEKKNVIMGLKQQYM